MVNVPGGRYYVNVCVGFGSRPWSNLYGYSFTWLCCDRCYDERIMMKIIYSMAIVSFPAIQTVDTKLNKFDYSIPNNKIMNPHNQNTMEYNYIRSEDYIRENILQYQDLIISCPNKSKE